MGDGDAVLDGESVQELLHQLLEWQRTLMFLIKDLLDALAERESTADNARRVHRLGETTPRKWRLIH